MGTPSAGNSKFTVKLTAYNKKWGEIEIPPPTMTMEV
jgi:hypothetical protein